MAQQTQALGRGTMLFNGIVLWFTRRGLSLAGSRELAHIGRRSGLRRTTPVNLLTMEGRAYVVAPRGRTEWVRNVLAHPEVQLRVGRRVTAYRATPLDLDEAVPVLRQYLKKWAWQVGGFFPEGISATSTDAELRAIAADHPAFALTAVN